MKCLIFGLLSVMFMSVSGTYSTSLVTNATEQRRTTDTCADPTLAVPYVEGYNMQSKLLAFDVRATFITNAAANGVWQVVGELFRAWRTQQISTVPMYRLFNPTTRDYIYLTSSTGSAPTVTGYTLDPNILLYVYPTQICNSVSIYSLFHSNNAHWYSSSENERDLLVADGWLDEGIVGYALPLADDCGCTS